MANRPSEAWFILEQRPASFAKSQNCIPEPPYGDIDGNVSALSERFNASMQQNFIKRMLVYS